MDELAQMVTSQSLIARNLGLPVGGIDDPGLVESRYANYKTLVERAIDVFGDESRASLWLSTPSVDFSGASPLQVAGENDFDTQTLKERFEPIFIRFEHGIDF